MSILRTHEVTQLTGLSRTTIWRLERSGTFPRRVRLSANSVGWVEDEVRDWVNERPRGLTSERCAQPHEKSSLSGGSYQSPGLPRIHSDRGAAADLRYKSGGR